MARGPVGAAAVSSSDGCSTAAALMQGQASTPASFRVRADASDSLFVFFFGGGECVDRQGNKAMESAGITGCVGVETWMPRIGTSVCAMCCG